MLTPKLIRLTDDRIAAADELKLDGEPFAAFVAAMLEPILSGEVVAIRDEKGCVKSFKRGNRSREFSEARKPGRPSRRESSHAGSVTKKE